MKNEKGNFMSNHNHDHVHGPDCDHDHDPDVVVVTDEHGVEHEMIMIYTFESQNRAYAVLLDRNNPDEDGMIVRIEEENNESFLVFIEDETEWEHVVNIYNDIVKQETNS